MGMAPLKRSVMHHSSVFLVLEISSDLALVHQYPASAP